MVLKRDDENYNSPASWILACHAIFNIVSRIYEATFFGISIWSIHFTVVVGELAEAVPRTRVTILTYTKRLGQTLTIKATLNTFN